MSANRYPLSWPASWPRTASYQRKAASFGTVRESGGRKKLSPTEAIDRLEEQLDALDAKAPLLSTNLELNLSGRPRGDRTEPADPGAAIYFKYKGRDTVLACDKWDRVADNIAAIAKHIEALRGQDRWGVGTLAQAFAGYQALPAPEQWWEVLGVPRNASLSEIHAAHRRLIEQHHPDRGGSVPAAARINAARDQGIRENG